MSFGKCSSNQHYSILLCMYFLIYPTSRIFTKACKLRLACLLCSCSANTNEANVEPREYNPLLASYCSIIFIISLRCPRTNVLQIGSESVGSMAENKLIPLYLPRMLWNWYSTAKHAATYQLVSLRDQSIGLYKSFRLCM